MAIDQHRSSATPSARARGQDNDGESALADLDSLLVRTAGGDQAAFRALYNATSGKLMAQAIAILRQRDAAEDALQDGFIRVWERAAAYDPSRGPAMPWMLRLVRNAAIDRLRRDRIALRSCDYDDYARDIPAPAPPVDDRLDLIDAMAGLTAEQRGAIVAVVIQGWTNAQAGARGGVPEATSKARVARGLRRMRSQLERPVAGYAAA